MWFKPKPFHQTKSWQALARKHKEIERKNGNWACKRCGDTGELQSDHILSVKRFPALRLKLYNLQLLCGPCNLKKRSHIQLTPKSLQLLSYIYMIKLIKKFVGLALIIFFGLLLWHDLAYHPFPTTFSYVILSDAVDFFYELLRYWESLPALSPNPE